MNTKIKTQTVLIILLELCVIGLLGFLLLLASNTYIYPHPSRPVFRVVGSLGSIVVLILFLLVRKPSIRFLGLNFNEINPKHRTLYIIALIIIAGLIIYSPFLDPKFLITNIRFGIVTPVFEEIIFRGYIWRKLEEKQFKSITIIAITSLLFGLFHLAGFYEISYATSFFTDAPPLKEILFFKVLVDSVYGILLGYARYKSGNLYLPLIIHSIGNIIGK